MRVKLVVIAAVVLATGPASAAVLCAKKSGVVVLRAACKRKEKTLDVAQFGAVGAKGDPGMPGMQGPRGVGPLVTCLPDSVLVGTTCVDKYEESVWQIDLSNKSLVMKVQQGEVTAADLTAGGATQLGCTGDPFNHAAYSVNFRSDGTWTPIFGSSPPSPGVYAVSIPGVLPSACTTWFQANQACQLSGKRLLTNREWQGAAASTPDAGGADDGATTCATHSPNPVAAGARPNCKSAWGAFDMVGNVYEWVADWSDRQPHCTDWKSTVGISADGDLSCFGGAGGPGGAADSNSLPGALTRGGAWGIAAAAGVFAVDAGPIPSESRPDLGFRCAR